MSIRAVQLRTDGGGYAGDVRITVRPVRLGDEQLSPLAALPSGFGLWVKVQVLPTILNASITLSVSA